MRGLDTEIRLQLCRADSSEEICGRRKRILGSTAAVIWQKTPAIDKDIFVGTSPLGLVGAEAQIVLATILLTTFLVSLIDWQLSTDASILIPVMAALAAGISLLDHILLKIQIQHQSRHAGTERHSAEL